MFTGLVEAVGEIRSRETRGPGARLGIATKLPSLVLGESIAVSGVCLTVQTLAPWGFEADASHETLAKTTLGARRAGSRVNLERAMPLGGRMGGHLVSGHVDGKGALRRLKPVGESYELTFVMPDALARFVAEKGSITVDGVSLTVNAVSDRTFAVAIIPHTWSETTLSDLAPGDEVNLEVDLVARYVARLVERSPSGSAPASGEDDEAGLMEALGSSGYL